MHDRSAAEGLFYREREAYIERCLRRLVDDLGIEPDTAEVIMSLRSQVVDLQRRLRELETELTRRQARRTIQLYQFREVIYEATWVEVEDSD